MALFSGGRARRLPPLAKPMSFSHRNYLARGWQKASQTSTTSHKHPWFLQLLFNTMYKVVRYQKYVFIKPWFLPCLYTTLTFFPPYLTFAPLTAAQTRPPAPCPPGRIFDFVGHTTHTDPSARKPRLFALKARTLTHKHVD